MNLKDIFKATNDDQDLRRAIREWAEGELAPIRDETLLMNEFSLPHFERAFNSARELGYTAIGIDEKYGGMQVTNLQMAILMEEVARVSPDYALMFATNSLVAPPITAYGTEEQKQRWLTGIASGEVKGAFCNTEAGAGSDAAGIKLKAEQRNRKWYLDGIKMFATLGCVADLLVVTARTGPERYKGITTFLVDAAKAKITKNESGQLQLEANINENKLGIHQNPTTMMVLQDCEAEVLGEVGKGFIITMNTFAGSRAIGIPPKSLGGAKAAYKIAYDYAYEREQFDTKIINFSPIDEKLIKMEAMIKMSELLMWQAATAKDEAPDNDSRLYTLEASCTKLVAAVFEEKVISDAIQILGGYGYIEDFLLAKFYRDARIDRLFEGTDEIQQRIIAGEVFKRGFIQILSLASAKKLYIEECSFEAFSNYQDLLNTCAEDWPFNQVTDSNTESLGEFKDEIIKLRKSFLNKFAQYVPIYEETDPVKLQKLYTEFFTSAKLPYIYYLLGLSFAVLEGATLLVQNYQCRKQQDDEPDDTDVEVATKATDIAWFYIKGLQKDITL